MVTRQCIRWSASALFLLGLVGAASGGPADVVTAGVDCDAHRVCDFRVTVRHDDTGWEHYADRWDVLAPDDTVLGTRVLHHPHETEQPFTRGLRGLKIPSGVSSVRIRAHDSVHGYGGREVTITLP